jgi:hypothetical protein
MLIQSQGVSKSILSGFIAVQETTAATLTTPFLRDLQNLCLNINDCCGQGYDNGANMGGMNLGVKTKILAINQSKSFLYSVWLSQLESPVRRCHQIINNDNQLFWLNSMNLHTFFHIFEEVGDFEPGTVNNF